MLVREAVGEDGLVTDSPRPGVLASVTPAFATGAQELVLPALLLRAPDLVAPEIVHVYVPHGPTVAFSARDLRSPGIAAATTLARDAGFGTVVRSPGGQMVAYDAGAVVIDHLDRTAGLDAAGGDVFRRNAEAHVAVLHRLGLSGARIGAVEGEYCPGEFSVNVAGRTKVIGSAQRVTGGGTLFSTVVQVVMSERVRAVIVAVSDALGYDLREDTVAGIGDHLPGAQPARVAAAFADDYRARSGLGDCPIPDAVRQYAVLAADPVVDTLPFRVDDWVRANPYD
ncbi:MAG: hypothetical protein JWQ74_2548 [Marmoricola sp.]|nr:hypothetical protein [Marmoricola sp.]